MPPARLLPADDPALAPSATLDGARTLVAGLLDDPGIGATAADVVAFLDEHPDALHRSCGPGHLTGSALVVDADGERTLVLLHRKLRRWLQPGGHADGDANLAAVALREATEETGVAGLRVDPDPVDIDIHRVEPPGEPPHLHLDVRFLVVAPAGARVDGNHESLELRWVEPDQLVDLGADPGLVRLAERGFARLAGRA